MLPNAGPGSRETAAGRDAAAIAAAAPRRRADRALPAARRPASPTCPGAPAWEARAGARDHRRRPRQLPHRRHPRARRPSSSRPRATPRRTGTLTHPDGRLQRLRAAIGHPGDVRAEWSVIADLARRVGLDLGVLTGPMATAQLFAAVPFYAGPDARRDRRPGRALAGARRGRGAFPAAEPRAPATPRPRPSRRPRRAQRAPAPGHLPLDLERAPRCASRPRCTSCTPSCASRCRPPTPSASSSSRATASSSAPTGTARRRDRHACARPRPRAPSSWRPTRSTGPLVEVRKA